MADGGNESLGLIKEADVATVKRVALEGLGEKPLCKSNPAYSTLDQLRSKPGVIIPLRTGPALGFRHFFKKLNEKKGVINNISRGCGGHREKKRGGL